MRALALAVSSPPGEQESRIAQVMVGGKSLQGWTSADERILRERMLSRKAEKIQALFSGKLGQKTRQGLLFIAFFDKDIIIKTDPFSM